MQEKIPPLLRKTAYFPLRRHFPLRRTSGGSAGFQRVLAGILPERKKILLLEILAKKKQVVSCAKLRTCEINRKGRVADGFLAWPRHEGGGNTLSGLAPPEQRRPSQKDTQPFGRGQKMPSGGVARSVTARRGDAPSRAPCHPAFSALARLFPVYFTGSQATGGHEQTMWRSP